jgi:hypothetical protein
MNVSSLPPSICDRSNRASRLLLRHASPRAEVLLAPHEPL